MPHSPSPYVPDQLDAQTVRVLLQEGMRQSDIAKAYSTSRQWVNQLALSLRNRPKTLREQVMEKYPWDLSQFVNIWNPGVPFSRAYIDKLLRDHLEYVSTEDQFLLSDDKRMRLRSFYRKLKTELKVVEFSPEIEPDPSYNTVGGFAYRDWKEFDETSILRINEYTMLDDEGEAIWQIPPQWPITEYEVRQDGGIG